MLRSTSAAIALLLASPAVGQVTSAPASLAPGPATAPGGLEESSPVVVHQSDTRSPFEIIAVDAAYGGLVGLLIGGGVALIEQGNFFRDISIGAGAGLVAGAIVGGVQAYGSRNDSVATATDGLGSPDRDPPLAHANTVFAWGGRF